MLRQRLRAHLEGLARPGPQLGNASDCGLIVESVVNEEASDYGAGAALPAPAVKVNHSATVCFVSNARKDSVVAVLVDNTHVRNGMGEVMYLSSGLRRREFKRLSVRGEVVVSCRQIHD